MVPVLPSLDPSLQFPFHLSSLASLQLLPCCYRTTTSCKVFSAKMLASGHYLKRHMTHRSFLFLDEYLWCSTPCVDSFHYHYSPSIFPLASMTFLSCCLRRTTSCCSLKEYCGQGKIVKNIQKNN